MTILDPRDTPAPKPTIEEIRASAPELADISDETLLDPHFHIGRIDGSLDITGGHTERTRQSVEFLAHEVAELKARRAGTWELADGEAPGQPVQITATVAGHVVRYLGDTNLGANGGNTINKLIRLTMQALGDKTPNGRQVLAGLEDEWPEYVAAVRVHVTNPAWGLEWLRDICKAAEFDLTEQVAS